MPGKNVWQGLPEHTYETRRLAQVWAERAIIAAWICAIPSIFAIILLAIRYYPLEPASQLGSWQYLASSFGGSVLVLALLGLQILLIGVAFTFRLIEKPQLVNESVRESEITSIIRPRHGDGILH